MSQNADLLGRITVCPDIFGGKPIIHGMRFAVEYVMEVLANSETAETILDEYPILELQDIQACLVYNYFSVAGEEIHERILVQAGS